MRAALLSATLLLPAACDSLRPMRFSFEPGEVDLTSILPPDEPVAPKVAALTIGGVGEVSDVFLLITADSAGGEEDLRDQ